MAHIREVVDIKAPPDKVFEILDDPEHFPQWMDGVVGVRFLSPEKHGLNSAIELTIKFGVFGFKTRAKVIDYEKGYQFIIESTPGIIGTDTVEPVQGGGSRVIWDFEYEIPSAVGRIADKAVFQRLLERSAARSLRNLKEKMEHGTIVKDQGQVGM